MSIAVTVADDCAPSAARVATWCKAVDRQAREFAELWGVSYVPVVFFSADVLTKLKGKELSDFVTNNTLLTIQGSLDVPGVLGFHADVLGVIFARVLYTGDDTSVTVSHEVLEQLGDPTCAEWAPLGTGNAQAREACDRVEGDTYNVEVDGQHVRLSNYLNPSAFVPHSPRPWDKLGRLSEWDGMTPGGYMIVREADGDVVNVFAAHDEGYLTAAAKRANPSSRARRRLGPITASLEGIDRTTAAPVLPAADTGSIAEDLTVAAARVLGRDVKPAKPKKGRRT